MTVTQKIEVGISSNFLHSIRALLYLLDYFSINILIDIIIYLFIYFPSSALSAAVSSTPIKDPVPISSSSPSDNGTPTPPTDPPPKTQGHLVKAHTISHPSGGVAYGGGAESHKDTKGRRATYACTDQTDQVLIN